MADPSSELVILEVPQPANHHNAEHLAFGLDGLLYVALGDGGVSEGLTDNAHDLTNVSGTIIRLDISQSIENEPYAIPADNPFIGSGDEVRKEIWAYGFRNPWRFDFDESTGRIWVADVGSRKREEVDLVLPGRNYGWPTMEGSRCFRPRQCDQDGLELPVLEYNQEDGNCAIIGGFVYLGGHIPSLHGHMYTATCAAGGYGVFATMGR